MPPTGWPSLSTTIVGTWPASVLLLESSLPPLLRTISRTTATTIASPPAIRVFRFICRDAPLRSGAPRRAGARAAAAGPRQRPSIGGSGERRGRPAGEAEGDQEPSPGSPRSRARRRAGAALTTGGPAAPRGEAAPKAPHRPLAPEAPEQQEADQYQQRYGREDEGTELRDHARARITSGR